MQLTKLSIVCILLVTAIILFVGIFECAEAEQNADNYPQEAMERALVLAQEKLAIENIKLENVNLKWQLLTLQQDQLKRDFARINNIIVALMADIVKIQEQIKAKTPPVEQPDE